MKNKRIAGFVDFVIAFGFIAVGVGRLLGTWQADQIEDRLEQLWPYVMRWPKADRGLVAGLAIQCRLLNKPEGRSETAACPREGAVGAGDKKGLRAERCDSKSCCAPPRKPRRQLERRVSESHKRTTGSAGTTTPGRPARQRPVKMPGHDLQSRCAKSSRRPSARAGDPLIRAAGRLGNPSDRSNDPAAGHHA